jgi:hypothetical protein
MSFIDAKGGGAGGVDALLERPGSRFCSVESGRLQGHLWGHDLPALEISMPSDPLSSAPEAGRTITL